MLPGVTRAATSCAPSKATCVPSLPDLDTLARTLGDRDSGGQTASPEPIRSPQRPGIDMPTTARTGDARRTVELINT